MSGIASRTVRPPTVPFGNEWGRFGRDAPERIALTALSAVLGVELRPRSILLPGGGRAEAEGVDECAVVISQFVLNQGAFSSQLRNKVLSDMFKLLWLRTAAAPQARCLLCIGVAARPAFREGGWIRAAAEDFGIELWIWDGEEVLPLGAVSDDPETR